MKHYYPYIDIMKGIAITLVVIGHVMLFSFDINPSEPSKCIYFNMPLFFYISGFLAYRRIDTIADLGRRLLKRGLILLIPYICFLTLYTVYSNSYPTIQLYLTGGQRYWFLYVLFILCAFFLCNEYLIRNVHKTWKYISIWILPYLILIIFKFILSTTELIEDNTYTIICLLANYYRYYLIGYLCMKYLWLNKLLFNNQLIYAIGLVAYFLNWMLYDNHNMILIFTGTLGAIIVIQTFVINHIEQHSKSYKALIYIGKSSLGIYVIHYFFLPNVSAIVRPYLIDGGGSYAFIWQLTASLVLSIPVICASIFVYKIIEQNRYLYLLLFGKMYDK